ncbi:hypothetical protein HDV05_008200, partial [Chytridiales sp. JEL 0842]
FDQISKLHSFLKRAEPLYLNAYRHTSGSSSVNLSHDSLSSSFSTRASNDDVQYFGVDLEGLKSLTDQQKDALDATVKMFLQGCVKRVKMLEAVTDKIPTIPAQSSTSKSSSLVSSILGSLTSSIDNEEERRHLHATMVAEHRRSIVWLLERRLLEASGILKGLQEKRLRMKMKMNDRYQHLLKPSSQESLSSSTSSNFSRPGLATDTGSSKSSAAASASGSILSLSGLSNLKDKVGRVATQAVAVALDNTKHLEGVKDGVVGILSSKLKMDSGRSSPLKSGGKKQDEGVVEGWDDDEDLDFPPVETSSNVNNSASNLAKSVTFDDGGKDERIGLLEVDFEDSIPEDQRLLLEQENEELLAHLESGLDQIRAATQSIHEISDLQSQMATHLQAQEKAIEQLHEDSVQVTETMIQANSYLRNAKRLFGETKIWLLVFFIVSSLVLLFLD